MAVENSVLFASRLWGRIIRDNPNTIVALSGAHYFPAAHGVASRNIPLPEHKGMLLEQDLLEERFPDIERDHVPGVPLPKRIPKAVFAVSSPAYIWTGDSGDPSEQKIWAKTVCYENEASLQQMMKWGMIQPRAMIMADFDCASTPENIRRITDVILQDNSKSRYVLDTGNGVHVVDEELFDPVYYPRHLGKLITDFVPTALPSQRHVVDAFGKELLKQWRNPEKLQKWVRDALRTFKHYDDTISPGIPFMLDMRHAAYSIHEYLRFMARGTGGWGFLRIDGKSLTGRPPFVVARQQPGKNIDLLDTPSLKTSRMHRVL